MYNDITVELFSHQKGPTIILTDLSNAMKKGGRKFRFINTLRDDCAGTI